LRPLETFELRLGAAHEAAAVTARFTSYSTEKDRRLWVYRTLIDNVGTTLGVQQRLMRHADIKTTMNTYGSAFEQSKRRANSRVAALVLPPAVKRQLKDRAKEV